MSTGQYVPSEMVVQLIIQKIDSLNNRYFVVEGFPKNQDNIDTWNRKTVGIFHTKLFLFFDVDKKVALERLQERSKGSDKPED
jgi:adenylate kinase family enzyme